MPQHSAHDPRSADFIADLAQCAQRLMSRIDRCYELEDHDQALRLEQDLEQRLWFLEHHLGALAEDEELEEGDDAREGEAGVEEQFVAVAYIHTDPDHPDVSSSLRYVEPIQLEEHLHQVLLGACWSGMAPRDLAIPTGIELLPLAHDLARDRARLIGRYRACRRPRLAL
ncbi:MAG: hypothetical protein GY719_06205 [bacterium]|nr:hypothetical protein [bacterium]